MNAGIVLFYIVGNIGYFGKQNKIDAFNTKTNQWTGSLNSPPTLAKGSFAINGIKAVKLKSKGKFTHYFSFIRVNKF